MSFWLNSTSIQHLQFRLRFQTAPCKCRRIESTPVDLARFLSPGRKALNTICVAALEHSASICHCTKAWPTTHVSVHSTILAFRLYLCKKFLICLVESVCWCTSSRPTIIVIGLSVSTASTSFSHRMGVNCRRCSCQKWCRTMVISCISIDNCSNYMLGPRPNNWPTHAERRLPWFHQRGRSAGSTGWAIPVGEDDCFISGHSCINSINFSLGLHCAQTPNVYPQLTCSPSHSTLHLI